jgi:sugar phosphate isomerase/epimerase
MQNPIAFSTLGCPEWNIDQILRAAVDYGYPAIELRGYRETLDVTQAEPFLPANRNATRRRFAESGVSFCCVSSSGVVAEGNIDHVRANAELAHAIGAPVVRVFGGHLPDTLPHAEAIAQFAETLRSFGDAAQEAGVIIVLETHDAFSTGATVAELLERTDHPAVFSLWDLHHPYRQGESPAETDIFIGETTRHTHLKDSKDGVYCLLGEGDIPLFAMLDLLKTRDYTGVLSLEWEKRWISSLAPPEVAFPQYAKALREYLKR